MAGDGYTQPLPLVFDPIQNPELFPAAAGFAFYQQ